MEVLKAIHRLGDDFKNEGSIIDYAIQKNVPETEKLTNLSGIDRLLLRSCPNPDELKLLLEDNRANFMTGSPHVSLQEYVQYYGRDFGSHWDSKVLNCGICFSYYPTIKMLREAKWLAVFPRNCLVRYWGYKLCQDQLIHELFDWKNTTI